MTWVSLGEDAYQVLRSSSARIDQVEMLPMSVRAPLGDGLVNLEQRVYLLRVDEDALPALSTAVHQALHRCGGYVVHASRAEEGRQMLARTRALALSSPNGLLKAQRCHRAQLCKINDSTAGECPVAAAAGKPGAGHHRAAWRPTATATTPPRMAWPRRTTWLATWQGLAAGRSGCDGGAVQPCRLAAEVGHPDHPRQQGARRTGGAGRPPRFHGGLHRARTAAPRAQTTMPRASPACRR